MSLYFWGTAYWGISRWLFIYAWKKSAKFGGYPSGVTRLFDHNLISLWPRYHDTRILNIWNSNGSSFSKLAHRSELSRRMRRHSFNGYLTSVRELTVKFGTTQRSTIWSCWRHVWTPRTWSWNCVSRSRISVTNSAVNCSSRRNWPMTAGHQWSHKSTSRKVRFYSRNRCKNVFFHLPSFKMHFQFS